MMGRLKSDQGQLFYEFHLGDAVPEDHLVRKIDAALDLSWLRGELAPHYSSIGHPSIDPELMIRIRQAEVGAAKTMIERTEERFGLKPERLAADTAYGAAAMLNWLVEEKGIAPHIPVFDKSKRDDGTFSRSDFRYDPTGDVY